MLSIFLGNSKLLFPKVPSSVYPTTQSILQQEDNEVIDSLSPAYKELPSTHFSYISCFNGSITSDASYCGNNQNTILPNSTKTSIRPHTNSLSSELNIQRLSNDSSISQRNTSKARSINNGRITTDEASTDTESIVSPLPIKPEQSNDSSLSIHITTAPNNPRRCPMSSTSRIIIEKDLKIQTESNENSGQDIEPENETNELAMNDDHISNVPAINDGQLNETAINDQQLNDPVMNDQRSYTQICEPNKNAATTSVKNTNSDAIRCDSSRGASSFGGVELSPKARAFSPDYYALTFRREGSSLSDVSCSSLRGASAFGGSSATNSGSFAQQKSPVTDSASHVHERGGSVFGQTSQGLYLENRPLIKHETDKQSGQFLNHESPVVNCRESVLETGRSSTVKEITHDGPENNTYESRIDRKAAKMLPGHGSNTNAAEIIVSCIQSVEGNSSKPQRENQSSTKMIKIPSYGNISALSNTNKRSNSQTSTKSCKANIDKGEKATGTKSGLVSGHGKADNRKSSVTSQIYKQPILLPKNNTSNSAQQMTQDKLITTVQSSPRDDKAPMTILQNVRDRSRAMKILDEKSNSKTPHLNNTYQSLRGASQLGRLGGNDDDVCPDNDALWDSISLSFAYESASEDDAVSQLEFKEN